MTETYSTLPPTREEIDAMSGPAVLEFGTPWCGHCRAARPLIESALEAEPEVVHIAVEDGPGRALGRSYRVKFWPTLIFLKDGREQARVVRPADRDTVDEGLAAIT